MTSKSPLPTPPRTFGPAAEGAPTVGNFGPKPKHPVPSVNTFADPPAGPKTATDPTKAPPL